MDNNDFEKKLATLFQETNPATYRTAFTDKVLKRISTRERFSRYIFNGSIFLTGIATGIVLKDTIIAIFIGNTHFPIEELYLYLLVGIVSVTAAYVYQVNKKYY